jgi:hypothetical protein
VPLVVLDNLRPWVFFSRYNNEEQIKKFCDTVADISYLFFARCDDEKEVKIEMKQEPADPLTITSDSFNHSENGDLPVLPLLKSEPDAAAGECKAVVNGLDPLGQQPGILQLADRLEEVASTAQVGISRYPLID